MPENPKSLNSLHCLGVTKFKFKLFLWGEEICVVYKVECFISLKSCLPNNEKKHNIARGLVMMMSIACWISLMIQYLNLIREIVTQFGRVARSIWSKYPGSVSIWSWLKSKLRGKRKEFTFVFESWVLILLLVTIYVYIKSIIDLTFRYTPKYKSTLIHSFNHV